MFLKFFFGKLYIIFAQRFPFFVINKKIIKKINGVSYELDLTQAIDSSLYFFGYFEKDTHKALNKLVTKNMTVFDIGANIGCHTFNLAKKPPMAKYIVLNLCHMLIKNLRRIISSTISKI